MSLMNLTVQELLAELGADSPAPGGGSVAALAGAMAASLCEMVAGLTLGREKLRDAWPAMERARSEAWRLGTSLRRLVDDDTAAYLAVVAARKLPRATPAEKAARDSAVQEAVGRAAAVPLETLLTLAELSAIALVVAEKGSSGCITDAGSAGEMIGAGARAAAWNVRINLPDVRDELLRARLSAAAETALAAALAAVERVRSLVESQLVQGSHS